MESALEALEPVEEQITPEKEAPDVHQAMRGPSDAEASLSPSELAALRTAAN